jgi:hypothetical protein
VLDATALREVGADGGLSPTGNHVEPSQIKNALVSVSKIGFPDDGVSGRVVDVQTVRILTALSIFADVTALAAIFAVVTALLAIFAVVTELEASSDSVTEATPKAELLSSQIVPFQVHVRVPTV